MSTSLNGADVFEASEYPATSLEAIKDRQPADFCRFADLLVKPDIINHMQRHCPHGIGIAENGMLYRVGYTGKRQQLQYGQLLQTIRSHMSNVGESWRYASYSAEVWHRLYQSALWNIETACGEDIHRVFEAYRPGSCMRYSSCRHMREVYEINPKVCGIIYIRKDANPHYEQASSSCLYWIGRKYIYLDRLYSGGGYSNGSLIDMFCQYLASKYNRPCHPVYNDGRLTPRYTKRFTFKLNRPASGLLPYCDTLDRVKTYDDENVWMTSEGRGRECKSTSGVPFAGGEVCSCNRCDVILLREHTLRHPEDRYTTLCPACHANVIAESTVDDVDDVDDVADDEVDTPRPMPIVDSLPYAPIVETDTHGVSWLLFDGRAFNVVLSNPMHQCRRHYSNNTFGTWDEINGLEGSSSSRYASTYTYRIRMRDARTLVGTELNLRYRARLITAIAQYEMNTLQTPTPPQPMTNAPEPLTAADVEASTNDATPVIADTANMVTTNAVDAVTDTVAPIIGQYGRLRNGRYVGPFRGQNSVTYPFVGSALSFSANGQFYYCNAVTDNWDIVAVMESLPGEAEMFIE